MPGIRMATANITLKVSVVWWLVPYINTLCALCQLMGTEPDWVRLERVLNGGIRIEV
jgi:hypothetical protein